MSRKGVVIINAADGAKVAATFRDGREVNVLPAAKAHEPLDIGISPEWIARQAELEPESGITSVGGLTLRVGGSQLNAPSKESKDAPIWFEKDLTE